MGQNYVAEIPVSTMGWTRPPELHCQDHARDKGAGRISRRARLKVRNTPAVEVRNILKYSPVLRKVPWERFRVKDGEKGPMVWEAKRIDLWIKDEHRLPVGPYHLVIARPALNPNEAKYFLSNGPMGTSLEVLLLVAFSRWRIERMFEDSKTELGMDHFEVRKYLSIQRHLILTCVSHLFLAEFCLEQRGGKPELTVCQVRTATRWLVPIWYRGGRCSRKTAESISAQLTITQERKAKARRGHWKTTLRKLHAKGITLKNLRNCHWPRA